MASKQIEIYKSAKHYADFIGTTVCNNIADASRQGIIEVSHIDLEKILSLVTTSVEQGAAEGMRGIESTVRDILDT
jgi:hypothetical protein